jgi:hypothetical protein
LIKIKKGQVIFYKKEILHTENVNNIVDIRKSYPQKQGCEWGVLLLM